MHWVRCVENDYCEGCWAPMMSFSCKQSVSTLGRTREYCSCYIIEMILQLPNCMTVGVMKDRTIVISLYKLLLSQEILSLFARLQTLLTNLESPL